VKSGNPLLITVYLDFKNAISYGPLPKSKEALEDLIIVDEAGRKTYKQEEVKPNNGDLYRSPAYIPVLVWRGDQYATPKKEAPPVALLEDYDDQGPPLSTDPKQLAAPKILPFAQYGPKQRLAIAAGIFTERSWAVTFTEFGEITNSSFLSKSLGAKVSTLFGSTATAASSIASEQQKAAAAASPNTQAAATQAKADEIYETQRLALCQAHPASCPGK
jgi:hypothetical protein